MPAKRPRADLESKYYRAARKKILMAQDTCAICGKPVDKTLPKTDAMSATVDHIISPKHGGHPWALDNLQLAHRRCNAIKQDKVLKKAPKQPTVESNRNLPQQRDWTKYKPQES